MAEHESLGAEIEQLRARLDAAGDDHERAQLEAAVAARTDRQAQIATRLETLAASAENPD